LTESKICEEHGTLCMVEGCSCYFLQCQGSFWYWVELTKWHYWQSLLGWLSD